MNLKQTKLIKINRFGFVFPSNPIRTTPFAPELNATALRGYVSWTHNVHKAVGRSWGYFRESWDTPAHPHPLSSINKWPTFEIRYTYTPHTLVSLAFSNLSIGFFAGPLRHGIPILAFNNEVRAAFGVPITFGALLASRFRSPTSEQICT